MSSSRWPARRSSGCIWQKADSVKFGFVERVHKAYPIYDELTPIGLRRSAPGSGRSTT